MITTTPHSYCIRAFVITYCTQPLLASCLADGFRHRIDHRCERPSIATRTVAMLVSSYLQRMEKIAGTSSMLSAR